MKEGALSSAMVLQVLGCAGDYCSQSCTSDHPAAMRAVPKQI